MFSPGSYLSAGYSFSPYGSKMPPGEEGEKARASPSVTGKSASESKALDILHQHASQYKSKSPTVNEKVSHERERSGNERERESDRPRSSPSQRIMPSHHHLGYPLLSGQYDLSYTGEWMIRNAVVHSLFIMFSMKPLSCKCKPVPISSTIKGTV